jgi:hypothetical protein
MRKGSNALQSNLKGRKITGPFRSGWVETMEVYPTVREVGGLGRARRALGMALALPVFLDAKARCEDLHLLQR